MEPPVVVIIFADQTVRVSVRFLFELQGWAVREYSSPPACLANLNPSCLVLGQDLPGALHLADEVRKRGFGPPVVLSVEAGDARFAARAAAAGVIAVDSFMPADLIAAVTAALSEPGSRRSVAAKNQGLRDEILSNP